jgi:hypothetical protein
MPIRVGLEVSVATARRLTGDAALKVPRAKSAIETMFARQLEDAGLPTPIREFRFHPTRRWQLDFYWPRRMYGRQDFRGIAIEVEGQGAGGMGRHQRPGGWERDMDKYNAATESGIWLYRVTGRMVRDGRAIELAKRVLRK